MTALLIAPKPFAEFGPDEYREYVQAMFAMPRAKRGATVSVAPGLTLTKLKGGGRSVRRSSKTRPFAYVTWPEIAALAKANGAAQSDLWNLFRAKGFIVAKSRMDAEIAFAAVKGVNIGTR